MWRVFQLQHGETPSTCNPSLSRGSVSTEAYREMHQGCSVCLLHALLPSSWWKGESLCCNFIPPPPPPDSVSLCIWMPQTICTSLLFCPFRSAQATCLLFSIHGFASTLLAECYHFFLKGSWSAQLLVFCVARVTWSDRSSWLASCWIANLLGILSEANQK